MVTRRTMTRKEILAEIERNISFEGDCHVWHGRMNFYRKPIVPSDLNTRVDVLRHLWNNHNERLHHTDKLSRSCQNERCVNVLHLFIKMQKKDPRYSTPDDEILSKLQSLVTVQGNCQLWNGNVRGKRLVYNRLVNGKRRNLDVQQFIHNLRGEKIAEGHILTTSCPHTNCIAASHLVSRKKEPDWDKIWDRMLSNTVKKAPPLQQSPHLSGDCLIWTASTMGSYGQSRFMGKTMSAHRAAYLVKTEGAVIPTHIDGVVTQLRHLCGRPLCIAPGHVKVGTILENAADKNTHGTHSRGENNLRAKISEETATKIKLSKFSKGEPGYATQEERAKRYGVTKSRVNSIDSGASWSHIKGRGGTTSSNENKKHRARQRRTYAAAQAREWTDAEYLEAGEILYAQMTKSETSKIFDVDGECWNYTGYIPKEAWYGYGVSRIMGKQRGAHTMSCEIKERRSIKKGEQTLHLCGNNYCIAPHHLTFGSPRENALTNVRNGSGTAKLDANKVRKIRDLTYSLKELALEFKVHPATIGKVRSGRTWSHIT